MHPANAGLAAARALSDAIMPLFRRSDVATIVRVARYAPRALGQMLKSTEWRLLVNVSAAPPNGSSLGSQPRCLMGGEAIGALSPMAKVPASCYYRGTWRYFDAGP
jgi:hypothetical protein